MPKRTGAVHVVTTTRHYKGKIYQSHLLCGSSRAGPHGRREPGGPLSPLPPHTIYLIGRGRGGEALPPADQFEVVRSVAHGDSHAVLTAIDKLGFEGLLS